MPIYEYQCQKCGHRMDALQKLSDAPLQDCPACGAAQLKRLISAVGFRLKGGGWYETDFKAGNKKNVVGSEDKASTSTSKESSDSAPATTSTTPSTPKTTD